MLYQLYGNIPRALSALNGNSFSPHFIIMIDWFMILCQNKQKIVYQPIHHLHSYSIVLNIYSTFIVFMYFFISTDLKRSTTILVLLQTYIVYDHTLLLNSTDSLYYSLMLLPILSQPFIIPSHLLSLHNVSKKTNNNTPTCNIVMYITLDLGPQEAT